MAVTLDVDLDVDVELKIHFETFHKLKALSRKIILFYNYL